MSNSHHLEHRRKKEIRRDASRVPSGTRTIGCAHCGASFAYPGPCCPQRKVAVSASPVLIAAGFDRSIPLARPIDELSTFATDAPVTSFADAAKDYCMVCSTNGAE